MKKFFAEPTMEIQFFAFENVVTASGEDIATPDEGVTAANAAVTVDFQNELTFTF
ncbi:MAG: hypothetical protein ACI4DP_12435 [Candidatus Ornithomonoglobus sp.]